MKKNSAIIFVLISCLFLVCGCSNDNVLFPIETNDKWGYIDKSGAIVITPQWDEAELFSEGLARVSVDGKYGYINSNGEYVIKPQFDFAGDFSEGMAQVSIGDMYGYINNKGKYIINPQFEEAYSFSNGLASVRIGNNFGCINKEGKFIIKPQYELPLFFSEGLALVGIRDSTEYIKIGYINRKGEMIIKPQFNRASNFSEGLACVQIGDRYGYINDKGKIIINPQFDYASDFSEGLAYVGIGEKYGYINKKGEFVINPQFDYAWEVSNFSEGMACVIIDGKYGYINQKGCIVINPQFNQASAFRNGAAIVRFDNKTWGYIDKKGNNIWDNSKEQNAKVQENICRIIPNCNRIEKRFSDNHIYHVAFDTDDQIIGVAIEVGSNKGFGGFLNLIVGFDIDGNICGYHVIENHETPGLGAKVDKWFQTAESSNIIGRNIAKVGTLSICKDGGDIDAISGATVTSRAFLELVNEAADVFSTIKKDLQDK